MTTRPSDRDDPSSEDRADRLERLFEEASALSGRARADFLDVHTRDDPALRAELESLLEHAGGAQELFDVLNPVSDDGGEGTVIDALNSALEGRYRVVREVGEGGMATVYLADDAKHRRPVALKVLKPELAAVVGAERFLTEIETTANLQHPHILPLFDSGEAGGFLFYVMPFVEGESLRERLDRERQLPVDEAVRAAVAVASALDYAHRREIVHRDIKPANILIHEGQPVVSDFGIALAINAGGGQRLTETGLSLGTPHYMSPEQTTGERVVDGRSDLYSLGCVVYEMLAGEPPFTAPSAQAVVAKILSKDATRLEERRGRVPTGVAAAVHRALEKVPADRFATAGEFADEIQNALLRAEAGVVPTTGGVETVVRAPRSGTRVGTLAATGALALLALWGWLRPSSTSAPEGALRFDITLPADQLLAVPTTRAFPFDLSPDGTTLAYAAVREGTPRLYLRRLDSFEAVEMEGTEGAGQPFFSGDGSRVGFYADRRLKWVPLEGGAPFTITGVRGSLAGASWGPDDIIVYSSDTSDEALRGELYTVPSTGGEPAPLTMTFDEAGPAGEEPITSAEGEWPHHLPDGEHLFVSRDADPALRTDGGTYVVSLATGRASLVVTGTKAQYLSRGHLAYAESDGAQSVRIIPLDLESLEVVGDPAPLLENVFRGAAGGAHFYRVSRSGTVVFLEEGFQRSVVLVDRAGNEQSVSREPRGYRWPTLSPDGSLVVLPAAAVGTVSIDTRSGRELPLGPLPFPVFRPDGTLFGGSEVLREFRPGSDEAAEPLVTWAQPPTPATSWTPDGMTVVGQTVRPGTGYDVVTASAANGWREEVPLGSEFHERNARLSPDGRWLVYTSDRSGRDEVWVAPWPTLGNPVIVSVGGGTDALWSRDGSEIFYRSGDRVMSVRVSPGPELELGDPVVLFSGDYDFSQSMNWDIGPDGRFLMIKLAPGTFRQFKVIYNLASELSRDAG